jgi:hypothetical protein
VQRKEEARIGEVSGVERSGGEKRVVEGSRGYGGQWGVERRRGEMGRNGGLGGTKGEGGGKLSRGSK